VTPKPAGQRDRALAPLGRRCPLFPQSDAGGNRVCEEWHVPSDKSVYFPTNAGQVDRPHRFFVLLQAQRSVAILAPVTPTLLSIHEAPERITVLCLWLRSCEGAVVIYADLSRRKALTTR
jgi:hypothetical protein